MAQVPGARNCRARAGCGVIRPFWRLKLMGGSWRMLLAEELCTWRMSVEKYVARDQIVFNFQQLGRLRSREFDPVPYGIACEVVVLPVGRVAPFGEMALDPVCDPALTNVDEAGFLLSQRSVDTNGPALWWGGSEPGPLESQPGR